MARPVKQLSLAQLNDLTLGAFAFVPTSETLDHAIRYLSTWSGSDKMFMIIQYAVKLIVPFLHLRARLQYRTGLRQDSVSHSAERWTKLAAVVSDSRVLWRLWGLLPILQWMTSMERTRPPTRRLLTIERLQGWSMLAYYPLEHLYYLCSHGVLPLSLPTPASLFFTATKPINLNLDALSIWSCRFWALYVLLQFGHLYEDRKLLKSQQRSFLKAKGKGPAVEGEKEELARRWDALLTEVVVNLGYLPLTLHWSLEKGLFKNDIWVGIFGLTAALASFRNGWKATALPPSGPSPTVTVTPPGSDTVDSLADIGESGKYDVSAPARA